MSATISRNRKSAAPRKRDAEATQAAILASAQEQFARLGYDHVSLRDIAGDAGADVALVKRYFGGKEGLFTEALKASFRPDHLSEWDRATFPRQVATIMADNIQADESHAHSFQFLLRAATSPATAPLLNVAVQERFLRPIRDWLGGDDAQARARVFAAAFVGFLVERLVRSRPLKGRERDAFIESTTAIFEMLLPGSGTQKPPRRR